MGFAALAFAAGLLVSLSMQLNGRLARTTSALEASFWNHIVGLSVLTAVALIWGGLWRAEAVETPIWAYAGGTVGVVFIAVSAWLVTRLGVARTTGLIIAGQMTSGVVLDVATGATGNIGAKLCGMALILLGIWLTTTQSKTPSS